ncbi:Formiminotransferase catalytic domain [Trinorchestia longiramus]|nr:Formiminotransferase catalytic domain [Trinorchestia longiramus]
MSAKKIIECVPNFSEGRDKTVIEAISEAVRAVEGVRLLDVDPGVSTNRTVYTFVGGPSAVVAAALAAARTAHALIDMTKHKGSHPRMGALDVCPFIPVSGVTVEECVAVAKEFGSRLAEEFHVPVFLYGDAAEKGAHRTTMPQIRAGEYEGLKNKLTQPSWQPDFGPPSFVPSWGATVTGVRKFLIAYNINLISTKEQAHRIALNLRTQGRGENEKGRLSHCQAIGWYLEEKNLAQISVNLTDFDVTPIHDAAMLRLPVTGSEIVGLVPLRALMQAAEYYMEKENLFILEEDQKIQLAIHRLGLSQLSPFIPKERIIEYCLAEGDPALRSMGTLGKTSVGQFVKAVAARTPAPGGGAVAAAVASLGSALGAMVGQLTYGKRQWEELDTIMRKNIPTLHAAAMELLPAIDRDAQSFSDYMSACCLPSSTKEEEKIKNSAVAEAAIQTVVVPLDIMQAVDSAWPALAHMAEVGNINCKSDVQVGARCLETGSWGAYYNVSINLDNVSDKDERHAFKTMADDLLKKAQDISGNISFGLYGVGRLVDHNHIQGFDSARHLSLWLRIFVFLLLRDNESQVA